MKEIQVKDLMVPVKDYATIHQDATLYDAVVALEEAQTAFDRSHNTYLHRAVLVFDDQKKIVGKLSQLDLLKGLEPKYNWAASGSGRMMTSGFSRSFLRSLIQQFSLWDKPLADVCKKAAKLHVKDCMYIPEEGEYVDAEDSLDVAIHQLVMGRHQSLLVLQKSGIVGILRLSDVFKEIAGQIKACEA
jgi:CBS domain-containing protein